MRDCQHKTIEKKLPRIETSSIVANSFPSVVVSFTQANLSVPTHSGQTQNVNTAFGGQSLESYAVEARDYSRELVHLEFSPLPRTKCAFSWSKLEPLEYLELQLVRCGMHDDRKQRSTIIMKVVKKRVLFLVHANLGIPLPALSFLVSRVPIPPPPLPDWVSRIVIFLEAFLRITPPKWQLSCSFFSLLGCGPFYFFVITSRSHAVLVFESRIYCSSPFHLCFHFSAGEARTRTKEFS